MIFLAFSVFGLNAQEDYGTKKIKECVGGGGSEQFCSSPLMHAPSQSVSLNFSEERRGIILENGDDEKEMLFLFAVLLFMLSLIGLVCLGISFLFRSTGYGVGGTPNPRR